VVIAPALLAMAGIAYLVFHSSPTPATSVALQPSPSEISLQGQAGSGSSPTADVDLGGIKVPYKVRALAPWIVVEPVSGERLGVLHVKADVSGLKPATYDGEIQIVPADTTKFALTNARLPVHLKVVSEPVLLSVEPQSLRFEYKDGGNIPSPRRLSIPREESQSVEAEWENGGVKWARIQRGKDGITIAVQPKGMPVGTHSATLVLSLPGAANSPQRVTVSLRVAPAFSIQ
jgi:hypothetical protein